jgi:hypothetical protein
MRLFRTVSVYHGERRRTMSEQNTIETREPKAACCSSKEQEVCCDPSAKAGCCEDDAKECGC